jgi:methylmalonyl-CoA mutase cobalamin-binding domain/chain
VVLAGERRGGERPARALAESLALVGIEAIYIGHEPSPARIAQAAVSRSADAVELCLAGGGGVLLLRQLLRELDRIGRRDLSLVVHRVR